MLIIKWVIVIGIGSLSGCLLSPQYKIVEHFEAPESKQDCIKKCQNSLKSCQAYSRWLHRECQQAKIAAATSVEQSPTSQLKEVLAACQAFSDVSLISELEARCRRDYRACYELCGGQIKDERICIAHCSK